MSSPIYNLLFGRARTSKSRKSPKRKSPKRKSPKRKSHSPRRRMHRDESNPCSMRKKDQCHYDPNCNWVKGSGCHRRAGVVSDEDLYEGPVFQRPDEDVLSTIAHGFGKARKRSAKKVRSPKKLSPRKKISKRCSKKVMMIRRK